MTHFRPIVICCATALVALLLGASSSQGKAANPYFGVMSQHPMSDDEFDLMSAGGIGTYRFPVAWSRIEPEDGKGFDWHGLDGVVRSTAERGIQLLPTLYHAPQWATGRQNRMPVGDRDWELRWERFIGAAVTRYGPGGDFWLDRRDVPYRPILSWQIWNEPNIRNFAAPVSARRYARLLKQSARTIRMVDPDAKIVLGGLYGRPPPGTGVPAGRFLRRLYKVPGVKRSFDVAAVHPYATTARGALSRLRPVRRVLNTSGSRGRRIAVTEVGWGSDRKTVFGKRTLRGQAVELRRFMRKLRRNRRWLRLSTVIWFSWSDLSSNQKACDFCYRTGLFDEFGAAKPVWRSLLGFSRGR